MYETYSYGQAPFYGLDDQVTCCAVISVTVSAKTVLIGTFSNMRKPI